MNRLSSLLFRLEDGTLTEQERDELKSLLSTREHSLEVVRFMKMSEVTRHYFESASAEPEAEESQDAKSIPQRKVMTFPQRIEKSHWFRNTMAMAAALLLCAGLTYIMTQPEAPEQAVQVAETPQPAAPAVYVRGMDVEFADDAELLAGMGLEKRAYQIDYGTFMLRFASGAEVVIEAPAEFRIDGDNRMHLTKGVLSATVPEEAIGFTVTTPTTEVRDLGTEFGIALDWEGFADILVFDGEIELFAGAGKAPKLMIEGDGVRVSDDMTQEELSAETEAYRFPSKVPEKTVVREGDNLVMNPSFEVVSLSRGHYRDYPGVYRDAPSAWRKGDLFRTNGSRKDTPIKPVHTSGVYRKVSGHRRTKSFPDVIHGEHSGWTHAGNLWQELEPLEPGEVYELTVSLASRADKGPGSGDKYADRGNIYEFGIKLGDEWVASESGQMPAGTAFHDVSMTFTYPVSKHPLGAPVLLLDGQIYVFYDNIRLVKKR